MRWGATWMSEGDAASGNVVERSSGDARVGKQWRTSIFVEVLFECLLIVLSCSRSSRIVPVMRKQVQWTPRLADDKSLEVFTGCAGCAA